MIQFKKTVPLLALLALTSLGSSGFAAELKPFSTQQFEQAQSEGKSIILAFHEDGCGSCESQKPKLEAALKDRDPSSIVAFQVEFAAARDLAKSLGVTRPTTLVLMKGSEVQARDVGTTNAAKIQKFVDGAV